MWSHIYGGESLGLSQGWILKMGCCNRAVPCHIHRQTGIINGTQRRPSSENGWKGLSNHLLVNGILLSASVHFPFIQNLLDTVNTISNYFRIKDEIQNSFSFFGVHEMNVSEDYFSTSWLPFIIKVFFKEVESANKPMGKLQLLSCGLLLLNNWK